MAFSDIFYPDNPKRREKVIRLHQELISCMESNFYVTNDLIGLLNTHLGCKITPIKMKENGTIKENCDIFIETMKKIQEVVQNTDEELKEKLEPSLYLKLHDITESDTTKMKIIESYSSIISGLAGTAASAAVIKLMIKKIISESMSKMATIMVKIGVSVFGLVVGAVVGIGVDMIISAIEGAIERNQLEESIQELEGHLKEFKPASREYQRAIMWPHSSSLEMLSRFLGIEKEEKRLIQASQSLHDYTHRYFSATNTVLGILNQHLNMNFRPIQVRENLSVHQNFILLMNTVQEIHATVERTDRHVQKNIGRPLYEKIALSHTSLQEKSVIVRDFHAASMGIFGSICGPITSVLLRNGNLPETLESAVQLIKASPVLALQVANLLLSCNEIAWATSAQAAASTHPSGLQHRGNRVTGDNPGYSPENPGPAPAQSPESNAPTPLIPNHNAVGYFPLDGSLPCLCGKVLPMFSRQLPRSSLEAAADEMERAVLVLRPSYESFQYIVDKAEVYITLINETLQ